MEELSCTPPELRKVAENTLNNLLPKKSREAYEKEYANFDCWCKENNVVGISENVLLAYFDKESKVKKASSLWSKYSMLKACLNVYKNIDISQFSKLIAFLKRLSEGYQAKKSKILEIEDINRFIKEADDKIYLAYKIILIMGYNGACRREEITNMTLDDIKFKNDVLVVSILKTKNYIQRQFIITEKLWIDLVNKYRSLRPSHITHQRFFLTYRNGYCVNSPIGINTIGKAPKVIATFLKLPNPELFTGHCFRRSSVSQLANSGGDLVTIKWHGGWKSSAVAEGYIDASTKKKMEVSHILSGIASTSTATAPDFNTTATTDNISTFTINEENLKQNFVSTQNLPGISINAQDTSTVTVNVYNNCTIHSENSKV